MRHDEHHIGAECETRDGQQRAASPREATARFENDECFRPESWTHEVIHPGLAERAAATGMGHREFVIEVVRQIPTWARGVLGAMAADALDELCQEFCTAMIERRPDLRYVPGRWTRRAYLEAVLRYTHWRLRRRARRRSGDDGTLGLLQAGESGPHSAAEQLDLWLLIGPWVGDLPPAERAAVVEALWDAPCRCPTGAIHRVRCCRGLMRLRDRAIAAGLLDAPARARRLRMPRTRRRRPNVRVVDRLGQRFPRAKPRSVPK